MDEALRKKLEDEPYYFLQEIHGKGICGLGNLAFTVGLFCGLKELGYKHRYCYEHFMDALVAIETWDGEGHPPGPWLVRKGSDGDLRREYIEE